MHDPAAAPAEDKAESPAAVGTRWVELGMAAFLLGIAALVITDSLRVGAGWADDGPRAGYFPFYIGLALGGAALWIAATQLRQWALWRNEAFLSRAQARDVWAVLWPMVVHVVLIKFIGIYLASALLIAWFMQRHGKHRKGMTAAVSLGVPLVFFVVFERWFVVPLPKGPLETWLGF